jgi:hypothetical protein
MEPAYDMLPFLMLQQFIMALLKAMPEVRYKVMVESFPSVCSSCKRVL